MSVQKPIQGTFAMLDFDFPDVLGWYPFFDELKEIGMDTVVIVGIAGITKNNGVYNESDLFNSGVLERFLSAAREKNFSVYAGLVTHDETINPASGNSNDRNSDKGRLIDFSFRMASKLMKFCEDTSD